MAAVLSDTLTLTAPSGVSPYASVVARVGERERWIAKLLQGVDWASHSFGALRPPSTRSAKDQTAALHWSSRLDRLDAGRIPKLSPLSI